MQTKNQTTQTTLLSNLSALAALAVLALVMVIPGEKSTPYSAENQLGTDTLSPASAPAIPQLNIGAGSGG